MSKTYLNKTIFINEYCSGMELVMVLFPIEYGFTKSIYFMKFKGLRHDLMFSNTEFIIFYQDVKFLPHMNEYEMFDRRISLTSADLINDLVKKGFELSSETNFPILVGDKKENIILIWTNGNVSHTLIN